MIVESKKGITALELLVSIAVMALLAALIITPFVQFRNNKTLETDTENTLSVLSKARGNTLASKDAYQYGVHFESSQVVLFRGGIYNSSDSTNEISILDPAIEISSISLTGGGVDVLFDRLTGKTTKSGTVVMRVKTDTSKTKTIIIDVTGITGVN